jgi:hypothetical protein
MPRQNPEPIQAQVQVGHPFYELIEEAYQVFAYPTPNTTGVCEQCCMDPKIEADFFNPPIRLLPLSYVRDWYSGAYNPEGIPKETWGYLLPRILEVLAAGEEASDTSLELSLNRFCTGNSDNWSKTEWSVLDKFQRMFLRSQIEQERETIDEIICMFKLAGWPLNSLFDQVDSAPDLILAQRLWNDWCRTNVWRGAVCMTSFWENADRTKVFDFYTSRSLYDRMEALALDDDTDTEIATKASAVAGIIEIQANWSRR